MGISGKRSGGFKKKSGGMSAKEHTQLGVKYWEQGRSDDAIREYKEALRIDPNYALARSNLGHIYDQQGRLDDAIREWEETLRRGVTSFVIRRNTEDWLREAKTLRDEREKQIGDVDSAVSSYMRELGEASSGWFIAYDALKRIGTPAQDALIQAIESDSSLLRNRAMSLLSEIGDERAIEPLTKTSKISEEDFRRIAKISGTTKTFIRGGIKIEISLADLLEEHRENAKKALKKIEERSGSK